MNDGKMANKPIKILIWSMGLPMVLSMVLQALYNVVDTVFVVNMGEEGIKANLALTYAFPVQIFMIAVGVGTGIGINALLSRSLGQKDGEKASKAVGNGIFLALALYVLFLIFGLALSEWFISTQTSDPEIIKMGGDYLRIVCSLSFGAIGFNVFERFLQSTGKTTLSMISQISGAATNIILDYVFIYPCGMGVAGAAYATIIGQVVSLAVSMAFHYLKNKEIKNRIKDVIPNWGTIGEIYKIGWSAMLMQMLLSVNMFVMIKVLSINIEYGEALNGAYGIYYKIQQIALFSCFGMSNALISLLSFNIGLGDEDRIKQCIKLGIIDTCIVALSLTAIFEALANQISGLFALASVGEGSDPLISLTTVAMRISSIGYVFMGISIAIQGILQSYRKALTPLVISLLRLIVFLVPFAIIFVKMGDAPTLVWISFPIAESLTAISSIAIMLYTLKKKNRDAIAKTPLAE